MSSDDLVAMTNRELSFAHAWATGRVRLDASFRDLLRLRALLSPAGGGGPPAARR